LATGNRLLTCLVTGLVAQTMTFSAILFNVLAKMMIKYLPKGESLRVHFVLCHSKSQQMFMPSLCLFSQAKLKVLFANCCAEPTISDAFAKMLGGDNNAANGFFTLRIIKRGRRKRVIKSTQFTST